MDKVTSEPAKEVFCKYHLKNTKEDIPITIQDDGFAIVLPYRESKGLDLTNEQWRELMFKNPDKLERMYQNCVQEVSSKNLLDLEDGGSQHLVYREQNKVQQGERLLNLLHFVNIGDIDTLNQSM
jgi:hypothetical protein